MKQSLGRRCVKHDDDSYGRTGTIWEGRYRELFRSEIGPKVLSDIRASANGDLVFGNERFKDEIERVFKRRSRLGRPGRPENDGPRGPGGKPDNQLGIGL